MDNIKVKSRGMLSNVLLHSKKNVDQIIPYFILFILIIFIAVLQPGALSGSWAANKIDGTITLILASMGQTLVFLVYGVDLSIAGVICLTNSLSSLIMPNSTIGIIGTILLMALIGIVAGVINGAIVAKLKLQAFIVTLATWSIFGGFALWVLPVDGGQPAAAYSDFLMTRLGGVPMSSFIIVILIIMWAWLRRTRFGISIYTIGRNPATAYYSGINVSAVIIKIYALSGLFAALAKVHTEAPMWIPVLQRQETGMSFLTCCATVLGGTNAVTGKGSLYGTIIGAFIIQLLADVLVFAGLIVLLDISNSRCTANNCCRNQFDCCDRASET